MASKTISVPLDELERLAAQGLPLREIAAKLGLETKQLANQINNKLDIKAAYQLGKTAFSASDKKPTILDEPKVEKPKEESKIISNPPPFSFNEEDILEAIADGKHKLYEIAQATRISIAVVSDTLNTLLGKGHIKRKLDGTINEYYLVKDKPTPIRGTLVSDNRLQHTIERTKTAEKNVTPPQQSPKSKVQSPKSKKKKVVKKQTALVRKSSAVVSLESQVKSIEPEEADVVTNGNHLPERVRFLLEAARLEIDFMNIWKEPSNKAGDIREGIESVLNV